MNRAELTGRTVAPSFQQATGDIANCEVRSANCGFPFATCNLRFAICVCDLRDATCDIATSLLSATEGAAYGATNGNWLMGYGLFSAA